MFCCLGQGQGCPGGRKTNSSSGGVRAGAVPKITNPSLCLSLGQISRVLVGGLRGTPLQVPPKH